LKLAEDTEKTKKSLEDTLKLNNLEMYNPTTLPPNASNLIYALVLFQRDDPSQRVISET